MEAHQSVPLGHHHHQEWNDDERLPLKFMDTIRRQTNDKPYAGDSFLKLAFLEGCEHIGLFEI